MTLAQRIKERLNVDKSSAIVGSGMDARVVDCWPCDDVEAAVDTEWAAYQAQVDALVAAARLMSEWYPYDTEACGKDGHAFSGKCLCRGCTAMIAMRSALAALDKAQEPQP
jgi:hypothetical protein